MTYSLHLRNGDLNFAGPGGYAVVSGRQKLIQDLKNWLLEPQGSDPFHPEYGSILNGNAAGMPEAEDFIGSVLTSEKLIQIEAEVRRVLGAYQRQQLDRLNQEVISYGGKNTFSQGEILYSVEAVDVHQVADTVLVRVSITTGDGSQLSFSQAVT